MKGVLVALAIGLIVLAGINIFTYMNMRDQSITIQSYREAIENIQFIYERLSQLESKYNALPKDLSTITERINQLETEIENLRETRGSKTICRNKYYNSYRSYRRNI